MATKHFCDICETEVDTEYTNLRGTVKLDGHEVEVFAQIKDTTACGHCIRDAVMQTPVQRRHATPET